MELAWGLESRFPSLQQTVHGSRVIGITYLDWTVGRRKNGGSTPLSQAEAGSALAMERVTSSTLETVLQVPSEEPKQL